MTRMMSLLSGAIAIAAVGATTFAVLAADDPIEARQKIMKANGAAAKLGAGMAKGETPFDLAKAKGIFDTFADAAAKMPDLFPDTSKTGHETTAAPKIWEDPTTFKAQFVKFGEDATAAKASVTDLDTFKAAFGKVAKDCGGCHETWRVKKG